MPAPSYEIRYCTALHLAGHTLSEKTRRRLEAAGTIRRLAEVMLGPKLNDYLKLTEKVLGYLTEHAVVSLTDSDYPQLLAETDTAPFILFLRGNREILSREKISIVGTREPSVAGRHAAQKLAAHFTAEGAVIVSGIARGIDAVAHHAALNAGGATCAVLPNGFDHLYPLENRDIYELAKSSDRILLLSEYMPSEKPQRYHFVRRNRIIAGLSATTVVIEAGRKSGAMITVGHALDAGRDVAALSHPQLTHNAGGEKLISEGALDLTHLAFAGSGYSHH